MTSIAWTITKRVEDTKATHFGGVVRWRENIKSTQLCGFARWRGKKYSYWLICTHITLTIPTILLSPSSNLETRETMIIAGVGRQFTTMNRNTKQDMPNCWVHVEKEEGKRRRSCEEI